MQTEPGRFAVSTQASRTLLVAKRQVASSEIDAIARRRARRESDVTTPSTTHVSLSEAFARQRNATHRLSSSPHPADPARAPSAPAPGSPPP